MNVNSVGILLDLALFVAGSSVSEVGRRIWPVRAGAEAHIELPIVREWCDGRGCPGSACVQLSVFRRPVDGRTADSDSVCMT